ncbi:MAG: histidinol-phosphatase [Firmicutes bacterium]|nr:histidinol-phosphatase [Bacillota bacterium]
MIMRKDYHTHTFRCQHAQGEVRDYAAVAVQKGLQVLGVTDHTPFPTPLTNERWNQIRMSLSQLDSYEKAITEARQAYPQLTILKGMECEYIPDFLPFYREELLAKRQFDYLIAGNHFFLCKDRWLGAHSHIKTGEELLAYAEHLIKAMASGLFAIIAHPDLFGNSYEGWDKHTIRCSKMILEAAAEYQIPLELNAYGLRKPLKDTTAGARPPYPLSPFWELAATVKGLTVVANSDAHHPADVGATEEVEEMIERYGLQRADLSALERAPLSTNPRY